MGWFGLDGVAVGGNNPEAGFGMAFSNEYQLGFTVHFTVFIGEDYVATVIA